MSFISNMPEQAWLTTISVAPGASGGPVLTEDGAVVATVVGLVRWPWGGEASIVVGLPAQLHSILSQSNARYEEVTTMAMLDGIVPLLKLSVLGAGAVLMYALLSALRWRGVISAEMLATIADVARRVVLAVEQSHGDLAGPDKKRIAEEMVGEILSRMGVRAPKALVDACVESAVLLMKSLIQPPARHRSAGER